MAVLVLVHYRGPAEAVRDGYARTAVQMAATPGLLGVELLHGEADGDGERWVLAMRWSDAAAFEAWERELRRQGHPSPLRPFQDRDRPGGHYEVFAQP
ncbi:antibiotic biosynthesis monooxygenase family protein [Sphaerisporangium fuscum]|uniref:antibiotic biosynthesis monooxygenase family protein n=1 Tax=Sphaerisporangium fuscum TaxID=2835868 RepID=UPI001BDC81DA|nr:antibiotic biosynthesis monooxygenase [Sphaerisporangium fuscum]